MQPIFVFASNLAGRHGKGSALTARLRHGAEPGVAFGRTGNAFAIPTKDYQLRTLPVRTIGQYVKGFLAYAKQNPQLDFEVVRIGCGLAGYSDEDIAPLFAGAPSNCQLPEGWRG